MKTVFVIDIDTTIADTDERAKLLEKECMLCLDKVPAGKGSLCPTCGSADHKVSPSSWDAFLGPDVLSLDKPFPKAQAALHAMAVHGMEFHFITGRREGLRVPTTVWLEEHFGYDPARSSLIMRGPDYENVAASVYKEDAFNRLKRIRGLTNTSFIFFEDDPYVFRVYQQYGIVIKCPEGWDHWCPEAAAGAEPIWTR